jgi:hypothetical protein
MEVANATLIATRNISVAEFLPPELLCSTDEIFIEFNGVQIFAM